MLSPLPKWPSNLDLVEARLLQHGPSGPEIDRPDPSLPAEPRKPATAEDTKLDPETIGFDPSFGEYDAEGHSSLDKYLSGSLFGNFMKWITSELWPQLEKYLGKGYDKLILQNLPPDRVNAHRDGQSSEKDPAAAMTPAEKANSEGLSYDQQVFLGTNLPNENGQQLSVGNTLLLKDFASFRESLDAKTPEEIGVMHDQITKHLESLVAFVDKPDEEEQASLAYVQSKAEFYKDLKAEIDDRKIADQDVLNKKFMDFNGGNAVPTMFTDQGKTLQTIIDAKNSDATASLGNKSALLLANYWLEQDFLLLKTLVPEAKKSEEAAGSKEDKQREKEKAQGKSDGDIGIENAMIVGLQIGKLELPVKGKEEWNPVGAKKLLRRGQDLFTYRHELHRHIIDNDKGINSSYLFANKLITDDEYQKLGEINSDVSKLVNALFDEGYGIPEKSSPLLNKYRNEIATKLSSSAQPSADKRVQAYYEQVLNYLDYAQAYVDRQPRVLFDKGFVGFLNENENIINVLDRPQAFEYIDHLGVKRSGELVKSDNGAFKLTLGTVTYTIAIKDKKVGIGPLYLRVDNDPATGGTVWSGLDYKGANGATINGNAFYLNEFIRVNGVVNLMTDDYKSNFNHYTITSDEPVEKPQVENLNKHDGEQLIDLIDDQNFDFPVGSEVHDIEIDNAEYTDSKVTFDLVVDDGLSFSSDRKFGTGTIEMQADGKFLLSVKAFGGEASVTVNNLGAKDAGGVSEFISKSLEILSALRALEWEKSDTWFKESNFNSQTIIQGEENDRFKLLQLDKGKKEWTIVLKDDTKIVANQVTKVKIINSEGLYLYASKKVNGVDEPVSGKIKWPTDIYGHIDRTEALREAANLLVVDYSTLKK